MSLLIFKWYKNTVILLLLTLLSAIISVLIIVKRCFVNRKKKPTLFFGPAPIINNKYWSNAMKEKGYTSKSIVTNVFHINAKNDFDKCYYSKLGTRLTKYAEPFIDTYMFIYVLLTFDILHLPFSGCIFQYTLFMKLEIYLYQLSGKKIIVMPYGADSYQYTEILDQSLKHVLLVNYPDAAKNESFLENNLRFFSRQADFISIGICLDAFPRWDMLPVSNLAIDHHQWKARSDYSLNDGTNGVVRIVHTPNHRGFKGSEYLIKAVEELKHEGLQIDLVLIEGKPNSYVKEMIYKADILAEQFVFTGYALSGIEGMASGVPVMANLSNDTYTTVFKRYSYLNECPIVSTSLEQIKDHLRLLITSPKLREEIGLKSRAYVEKYHSFISTQIIFEQVYKKIWENEEIDLINYFHPILGRYNQDYERHCN